MKMTKCCVPNCDMEIPSACLKAIELAIKGDEIAVKYNVSLSYIFAFSR